MLEIGGVKPIATLKSDIKLTLNIGREGGGIIPTDKVRKINKLTLNIDREDGKGYHTFG